MGRERDGGRCQPAVSGMGSSGCWLLLAVWLTWPRRVDEREGGGRVGRDAGICMNPPAGDSGVGASAANCGRGTPASKLGRHDVQQLLTPANSARTLPRPCPPAVQLSHIHLHEAEHALLQAIALLLTSIICVPLVVSKIPGASREEEWGKGERGGVERQGGTGVGG